jgi:hypothetical protein
MCVANVIEYRTYIHNHQTTDKAAFPAPSRGNFSSKRLLDEYEASLPMIHHKPATDLQEDCAFREQHATANAWLKHRTPEGDRFVYDFE